MASKQRRSLSFVLRREIVGKFQYHVIKVARGVIHVGANLGQEREVYERNGLDVVWIEPIEDVFRRLSANIADCPRQRAFRYLVTDKNNEDVIFHVASNDGSSSSILELGDHRDIFPDVDYVSSFSMKTATLERVVELENIDMSKYDFLLLDTQGSELLVLRGAAKLLPNFRFVQVEAADFDAYKGCCKVSDIESFMASHGFREVHRKRTSKHPNGGQYFELVFSREPLSFWERLKV